MSADRRAQAIASLLAARRGGPLAIADRNSEPAGIDDAHDIQAAVAADLRMPIGGWKVGRWDADAPLFYAPIHAGLIRSAPDTRQHSETRLRGLELEIAFRIDGPLPAKDAPDFLDRLAAVVTPMPAFEVVDSRLADPQAAGPLWRLADFQMNAGLILGEALTKGSWKPEDFANPTVRLSADGTDVANGPARLNTRTPFTMLADLVRDCRHCGGVQPGHVVTTGSFTGLNFFAAGATLRGEIQGMTPITMTFAA